MTSCACGSEAVIDDCKLLVLDSSTLTGSIALCQGALPVAESVLNLSSTHSERLLGQIDALLDQAGWALAELDLLAAVTGPGSFTGLRIGVATLKGLAQALNKPVVALSSLQLLAMNVPLVNAPVHAFLDARKQEVYSQPFVWRQGVPTAIAVARVVPPRMLLTELRGEVVLVGNAVPLYRQLIDEILGERALLPPPPLHQPRAAQGAWLALQAHSMGQVEAAAGLLPSYVRPSDAELSRVPTVTIVS
jgi:tRNA threonylcarbamoyladenosine biosynthesis protein TsaB